MLGAAVLGASACFVPVAASADAYSVTSIVREEALVVNGSSIAVTTGKSRRATVMIVASPFSTKHPYLWVQMQLEFDCPAGRYRFTAPLISGLTTGQYGREEAPRDWMDTPQGTKMGAALAFVCGADEKPPTFLGDFNSPNAVADAIVAAYRKIGDLP
jgi:hypothetical protein